MCFPALTWYCCDIHEWKDMSFVKHSCTVRKPCARSITKKSDMQKLQSPQFRAQSEKTSTRKQYGNGLEVTEFEKREKHGGENALTVRGDQAL